MILGSSPHARGLHLLSNPRGHPGGIIPARAGFTYRSDLRRPKNTDHPRTRGVYTQEECHAKGYCGSSPHARGLRRVSSRGSVGRRIIPARAGFTVAHLRPALDAEDHPRTRGVYGVMRTL